MCIRHFLARKSVAGGLVLSDLVHVRIDPQLIQAPAEKHHIGRKSIDEQFTWRRQVNTIACASNVVLLVTAVLEIPIDLLTRRTEICDRLAYLFGLAPAYP